jgi:sulfatase maturation enzyme AslB (radical SAM superfamily)
VRAERFGADSERQWHNNVNPNFDYATAGDQYHYPVIVDVRWNTTCNLSCNYCGEACSSKWAGIKGIPFKSGARPYYDSVCDFIEQHYEHIHEVALVGGEPLLLPENNRLLDVIPDTAIVTLITNLSNPLENNRIFKKLSQRQRVGWSISFDNLGDRFEYVRYGASWKLMLHNLDLVQDLMKNNGHWGGIHAVYNLYNATRLQEFKRFADERGLSIRWQNIGHAVLNQRIYGKEIAELVSAVSTIQIHGLQHMNEKNEMSSIALIKQLGQAITMIYLIARSLGLSEQDIKELAGVSLDTLKSKYPNVLQTQKLDT